jgi:hypothetical protein
LATTSPGRFDLPIVANIGSDKQDYQKQLLHRFAFMRVGTGGTVVRNLFLRQISMATSGRQSARLLLAKTGRRGVDTIRMRPKPKSAIDGARRGSLEAATGNTGSSADHRCARRQEGRMIQNRITRPTSHDASAQPKPVKNPTQNQIPINCRLIVIGI